MIDGFGNCNVCGAEFDDPEAFRHAELSDCVKVLKAKIERLLAIVDKMPKCWRLNETGELVQDVPIVPMTIWIRYAGEAGVQETTVRRISWGERHNWGSGAQR